MQTKPQPQPTSAGAAGNTPAVAGRGHDPAAGGLAGVAAGQNRPAPSTEPQSASPAQFAQLRESLQTAATTLRASVALALRAGQAQARIALSPPTLGTLRIHLAQGEGGLVARVIAEDPAAARLLAANQSELKATLSGLGVPLLSLQIGTGPGTHDQTPPQRRNAAPGRPAQAANAELPELQPTPPLRKGLAIDLVA